MAFINTGTKHILVQFMHWHNKLARFTLTKIFFMSESSRPYW